MALGLVVAQGLSAREAWAQVRRPVPHRAAPHRKPAPVHQAKPAPEAVQTEPYYQGDIGPEMLGETVAQPDSTAVHIFVDQPPTLPGVGDISAIADYIQRRVHYPQALKNGVEGRVYATFIVGRDGVVREASIVKGLGPLLDAEALRVIQMLPAFVPGRQGGRAVAVRLTLPVTFKPE